MTVGINLVTPSVWGAAPPRREPVLVGKSVRIIQHATAGNARSDSKADAFAYARMVQKYHFSQGWNDTGQNFTVMRNGLILVGRWFTTTAIKHGRMVRSSHCPGQNDQIGIEAEHSGTQKLTPKQRASLSRLYAWIADQYGRSTVLPVDPHSRWFATACPVNLTAEIPSLRAEAQKILTKERA